MCACPVIGQGTVQVTFESELVGFPVGPEFQVFGLTDGDRLDFVLTFDFPTAQGLLDLQNFEILLGDLTFVSDPAFSGLAANATVSPRGNSGLTFAAFQTGSFVELNQGFRLFPETATGFFFISDTTDIGTDLSQFPTNFTSADIVRFDPGVFGLSQDGGPDVRGISTSNLTGLTITTVPEPSSMLLLVSLAGLVGVRRRR